MAVVVVLATIAYLRAGWSLGDAIYMVSLTVYTVGYGEVRPIDTPYLHAITMATMVFGCTGMIVLTGALNPARFQGSDAVFNIGCAVGALQTLPDGVYIAMNGRIWDPLRVRKNREANRFEASM